MSEGKFVKALQDCGKKQGMKLLILSMEDYNTEVADKIDSLCYDSRYLRLERGQMIIMPQDVRLIIECTDASK